jgi:hypothetical protein
MLDRSLFPICFQLVELLLMLGIEAGRQREFHLSAIDQCFSKFADGP